MLYEDTDISNLLQVVYIYKRSGRDKKMRMRERENPIWLCCAFILIGCVTLEERLTASMPRIPHLSLPHNPQGSTSGVKRRGQTYRRDLNVPRQPGSS